MASPFTCPMKEVCRSNYVRFDDGRHYGLGNSLGAHSRLYAFRLIQAVVSKEEMSKLLPDDSPRTIVLACGLGAASSSCSMQPWRWHGPGFARARIPVRRWPSSSHRRPGSILFFWSWLQGSVGAFFAREVQRCCASCARRLDTRTNRNKSHASWIGRIPGCNNY